MFREVKSVGEMFKKGDLILQTQEYKYPSITSIP